MKRFLLVAVFSAGGCAAQFSFVASSNDLVVNRSGAPVLSFRERFRVEFEAYRKEMSKDELPCTWERELTVLSLAGRFLGLREDGYESCRGAAHPSVHQNTATYDLSRPGERLRITDLFPEQEVLTALSRDRVLARYLKAPPRTLQALAAALPEEGVETGSTPCTFQLDPGFQEFAVIGVEAGKLAVRISLQPMAGACHAVHPELGILLNIPASWDRRSAVFPVRKGIQPRISFEATHQSQK